MQNNNTVDIKDESLEDAAANDVQLKKAYSAWANKNNNGSLNTIHWKLIMLGANWQKQKDKANYNKLVENNGLMKIELDNTKRLLQSCETSLEIRNTDIDSLKAENNKLVECLQNYFTKSDYPLNGWQDEAKQLLQSIEQTTM